MKKRIRNLSLIVAFALLAAFIPLLRGSGTVAYADGDFLIENGVLKKYNGTSSKVVIPDLEILYQTDENIYSQCYMERNTALLHNQRQRG